MRWHATTLSLEKAFSLAYFQTPADSASLHSAAGRSRLGIVHGCGKKAWQTQLRKQRASWAVVAHAFNTSTREAGQEGLCEYKAGLIYKS